MHILFLTDNFPPEVNAPASRTFEHCREWVRQGHEVTVITSVPNFPDGKVFQGYRNRLLQEEILDGIRVLRVWTFVAPNQGTVVRILDYLSFMMSSFMGAQLVSNVDVVIGTSPQFFTAWAAFAVSLTHRAPFVFELRDLWPDSIVAVGAMRPGVLIRMLEKVELFLYRKACFVAALTPAFKENLMGRGIDGKKIEVFPNAVELDFFKPGPKPAWLEEMLGAKGKLVVSYIGTVGMAHAVHRILEVAQLLEGEDRLFFMILGGGAEWARIKTLAEEKRLKNLKVLSSVSKHQVLDYYRLTDIFLVTLRDKPLFRTVIPSKIFEAMAVELPIVCSVDGQCRQIVEQSGAGLCVQPENIDEMVGAILQLAESKQLRLEMGKRGREFVEQNYDRRVIAERFLKALEAASRLKSTRISLGII